jgi:hypothetical protein
MKAPAPMPARKLLMQTSAQCMGVFSQIMVAPWVGKMKGVTSSSYASFEALIGNGRFKFVDVDCLNEALTVDEHVPKCHQLATAFGQTIFCARSCTVSQVSGSVLESAVTHVGHT